MRRLGLWLKESTGVDLSLVYDTYDRSRFLWGLATTVLLMLLCVAGSLMVGVVGALVSEARIPLLSRLARIGCVLGRMTPPLLQMYLLVFGLGTVLMTAYGVSVSAFWAVVACLSHYTGASVMVAFIEAAQVKRQTVPGFVLRWGNFREVLALSSAPVTAALINVSKATMMASAVAVPELLSVTTSIMADNGNVAVMMNALLLTFLLLVWGAVRVLQTLERKLRGEVL